MYLFLITFAENNNNVYKTRPFEEIISFFLIAATFNTAAAVNPIVKFNLLEIYNNIFIEDIVLPNTSGDSEAVKSTNKALDVSVGLNDYLIETDHIYNHAITGKANSNFFFDFNDISECQNAASIKIQIDNNIVNVASTNSISKYDIIIDNVTISLGNRYGQVLDLAAYIPFKKIRVNQYYGSLGASGSIVTYSVDLTVKSPTASMPVSGPIVSNVEHEQGEMATPLLGTLSDSGVRLKWYAFETGGMPSNIAPTPNTSIVGIVSYWVSQVDVNGCESVRSEIKVTVVDTTPPIFENSTPSAASIAGTSFTLNTDINETGKIYYVAVADGATVPTSAEVKAGTASGGGAAIKSAKATVSSGGFTNVFSVTGLIEGTAYDVYVVAQDDEATPNLQAIPTKIDVTTTKVVLSISQTNITGNGLSDGTATVVASGGVPAYQFLWSDGQTTATATGLIAGNYTVTVRDDNGNGNSKTSNTITITQPDKLVVTVASQTNISVNGASDGAITVAVTGGVTPYFYAWNDGQVTATATGLVAGNYHVTVTDANGIMIKNNDCYGSSTGSLCIKLHQLPSVTTDAATIITANGATVNGNVTADGGATITERGFVYALTSDDSSPTLAEVNNTTVFKVIVTGTTGAFTKALTSLKANSNYSVIAFATNSAGTTETTKETFTTINTPPIFTSTAITSVGEGDTYGYNIIINDVDGDAVTVSATTKPSWLNLTSGTIVSTIAGDGTGGFLDGTGVISKFLVPNGIAVDASDNVYVADRYNHRIRKITAAGVVSTLAGSGTAGFLDGTGALAQFNYPNGVAVDILGNVYVAEGSNRRIRKITAAGEVSTLAGSGASGSANGSGTAAQFKFPTGVAVDVSGNVYVADQDDHRIRKITVAGVVSTFAGDGTAGFLDGTGVAAKFYQPNGIGVDALGNVYVVGTDHRIRKITTAGVVSTLAGNGTSGFTNGSGTAAQFNNPSGVTADALGNVYVADRNNRRIRKITATGVVSTFAGSGTFGSADGLGTAAQFGNPNGIGIDALGNIYVADTGSQKIRKITQGSVLSGDTTGKVGDHNITLKAADGNGGVTQQSFTITVKGKPTVTTTAATIITASGATVNGNVTANGGATITERGFVYALTTNDSSPTLAEVNNTTVFKVVVTGTTGAFTKALTGLQVNSGYSVIAFATNSVGTTESSIKTFTTINTAPAFTSTAVTAVDEGDAYNYNITTNDVDGDVVTITAATLPSWLGLIKVNTLSAIGTGAIGNTDGDKAIAQFHDPASVAVDASGNMYVGTNGNYTGTHIQIRKITPDGIVSTFAGAGSSGSLDGIGTNATFSSIYGMDIDDAGNVYVADGNSVRKITPERVVTTLGTINQVVDVVVDSEGNVYGAEYNTGHLYKIVPGSAAVLFAPSATGGSQVAGLSIDDSNNVYISSRGGKIFKVTPAAVVTEEFSGLTINGGLAHDANGDFYYTANGVVNKLDILNGVETTVMSGIGQTWGVDVSTSGNVYAADRSNHQIKTKVNNGSVLTGDTFGNEGSHNVVLKAVDGNGGITTQNFTIIVNDITAPTITKLSPLDNATGITVNSNLVLTFNENIVTNTGNITIHDASDDSLIETVSVTSGNVTTTNKVATINPTVALAYNKNYYVKVAATAFKDAANNNFAGITDKTTWRFATELRIAPTITFANVNKTYGDANFNLAATSNSGGAISYAVISGGTGTAVLSGANNKTVNIGNAGTVTIRATQVTSGMYTASTKDMLLTINKATLLVSAANKTKVYGDVNPVFTFNYLSTSFKNGETYTALSKYPVASSIATTSTNVGMVPITLTGGEADNYDFSYTSSNLTITKAALTATARDITREYGDANPALIIDYLGFKNSDDASNLDTAPIATTTAVVGSNVGSEIISLSAGTDDNYTITSISGKLTISKATLIVTAKNQTINYGDNFSIGFDYGAFKNGEDASVLDTGAYVYIVGVAPYNVGTYVIKPDAVSDNNYTPSYINGTLTVNKVILTATADDKSKEYGDANPAFTILYSGFKGSDSVADIDTAPTAASTATTTTSVGSVGITTIGGTDNNYTISTVNGTLTIGKATLTATADDKNKEYGDANPAFTISYSGFKGSDSVADIDTTPTATSTASVTTNVGSEAITLTEGTDNNYTISNVNGTLTIGKATLIASADDKSKVFGKANPTFTITYNGFVNTDTATDLDTAPVASTTATNSTPAGTVSISLSAGVDTNYTITNINGTLTILIDTDGDGDPDITDEDDDNDGVLDVDDNSPEIPNSDQQDTDGDGTPDVEEDCDNDGVINYFDTDTTKCTDAITQKKKYGFSPNGDGINDTWTIDNIYLHANNTVKVFNRSGKMVFQQKAYKNTWNGVSNKINSGQRLPVGSYLFIIELNEAGKKPIQGWLYINY
ncbi:MBG domain-containing protein [Tenacibaculum retecalamus]|uniref:MBG domain-containing protein n=1 Tax=Tenacibaculum retecalamus TaxID=3018315 RepID=UPI0023D9558D|nr:MBG domain-containing protein [Tenacibaculum retecalamus]WBX70964.1 MBG domain-containing protein [Tenacibaculum retecalamus]